MRARVLAIACILIGLTGATSPVGAQETLVVFAAASLKNAIDEVNASYTKRAGTKVVASYAGSPALVRQIEQGAPADIFASADVEWMDYAAKQKLVADESRVSLLGNRLVLIAARDARIDPITIAPGLDLAALAGNGRIVTGDVRAVPVGRYAKAALEKLGIWTRLEKKLAMAENVRAALALVARGEAPLGIVYATDARIEPNVKVMATFPEGSHPPIVYPVAAPAGAKPAAARYLAFLRSWSAKSIFESYGFTFLIDPTS